MGRKLCSTWSRNYLYLLIVLLLANIAQMRGKWWRCRAYLNVWWRFTLVVEPMVAPCSPSIFDSFLVLASSLPPINMITTVLISRVYTLLIIILQISSVTTIATMHYFTPSCSHNEIWDLYTKDEMRESNFGVFICFYYPSHHITILFFCYRIVPFG